MNFEYKADDFSLTDEDIALLVRFIEHGVDAECDCFSPRDQIDGNKLMFKFRGLVLEDDQDAMDELVRTYGEL